MVAGVTLNAIGMFKTNTAHTPSPLVGEGWGEGLV